MTQFPERLRLDLPDAFAGYCEMLTDFFERVLASVRSQTKPHLDDFFFTRRARLQDFLCALAQVYVDHSFGWILNRLVLNEIAKMRIFFLADRSLERDRFLRDLQHLADLRRRN